MFLRSPIFRKLLLSGILLTFVTLAAVDFLLTGYTAGRELEHAEHQAEVAAGILATELPAVDPAALGAWARQAQKLARARVTVIGRTGAVLADSQHDPETMENHAGRPEVSQAMAGRPGSAIRHSATLDVDFCYIALPAQSKAGPVVLRLAVPLREIRTAVAEVRWRILRASLVAAALALLVAVWFSRAFSRRIGRVQALAEGLVEARFSDSLPPEPRDELGELGRSLRRIAEQLRDMLDRLAVESARREAILASMVEGVLAVDGELRVTFCNESFARAVGARMPVPERLPLLQLIREPSFLDVLARVLATGEPIREKLSLASAQGRAFAVQAAPLEHGARRGAIAILHDITEIERLERVRTDFVASVSHELRTPLASIRGYAETLLDGALEDRENNRKFLEIIRAQAIRLNNVAADLLVLSELEAERTPAPPERIPVREAVQAAMQTVESEARVREVNARAGELEDLHIMGQRFRLEQALVNLLDNAIKFNRPGGKVLIEAGHAGGGMVCIQVSDTGSGISSEDLPRIFERFYRADKARSREVGGTGLGLSIVKHIAEKMNGTVAVESRLGRGSTFTLRFPGA